MHTFSLPFGKEKIKFELPEEQVAGVLVSHAHEYKAPKSEAELVADALANPIGSPKLSELAKGKKNCVIIGNISKERRYSVTVMIPTRAISLSILL